MINRSEMQGGVASSQVQAKFSRQISADRWDERRDMMYTRILSADEYLKVVKTSGAT